MNRIDALLLDLRYAIGSLRRSPGFTAVAVVTLALGIGANAAMFQLLNAVQWRTLAVRDPHRLIEIRVDDMTHARGSWLRDASLTNPIWERLRGEHDAVTGLGAWADEKIDISAGGEAQDATVLWVSGGFFDVLGVQALHGRLFEDSDDTRGCGASAVVLSYGFWQQQFGGDPAIVGHAVPIGRMHPYVAGVTPPSFTGPEVGRAFDLAAPVCAEPAWHGVNARLDSGMVWWLTVIGRLKPDVTFEQAAAMLRSKSRGLFEATLPPNYPPASVAPYRGLHLITLRAAHGLSRLRTQYVASLELLLAITTVVLLIACLNLAHLTRARASSRNHEIAVRVSLGAPTVRLAAQLVAESVLVTMVGLALAAVVARALCLVLISLLSADGTRVLMDLSPDWRTFGFLTLIAVVTVLIAAAIPMRDVARTRPAAVLARGRQQTAPGDTPWVRRTLLASQIAFSLVLLVAAAMFVRSLRNLDTQSPGFQPRDIIVADVSFADLRLPSPQAISTRQDLLERLRRTPMVDAVAEALILPATGGNWNSRMWLDGADRNGAQPVMRNMIGTDYFHTLATPVRA